MQVMSRDVIIVLNGHSLGESKLKPLIKSSVVLSIIIGIFLGIITLIPLVNCLACLAYSLIGAIVVFYFKRNNLVGVITLQEGALIGAVSGFVSFISASAVYLPLSYLINLIFYSANTKTVLHIASSFLVTSFNLFVIIMLVFFMAILSSLFNAFSALAVAFIYEKVEKLPSDIDISQDQTFIINQD